ncbi:MAG TPA: PilZ domain-containing protein [Oligoflexus sp.]|uniref:PilZ domain-containing protein n=1 Tax=Oligoflexus sp. TaxID=1971216 RepID=UPI002D753E5B|nr:PilZ domain-containing protein [Oligoflexus sp.]HYX37502.1 PilZ domain-containing protein [Oligoflexus sp.]
MLLAKKPFKKQREPRVHVLPIEIKGLLVSDKLTEEPITPFLVWDISPSGLGILLSDRLKAGDIMRLTFSTPIALTVVCSVVWCELQEADYDFQEPSFRVGLITVGNNKPLQPLVDRLDQARLQRKP